MFGKFEVIHLCGITRNHYDIFRQAEEELTKQGYIVFKPVFYDLCLYNKYKDIIDEQCYEKLLVSDIICIVTPEHIGVSTLERINQATKLGKKIMYWNKDKCTMCDDSQIENVEHITIGKGNNISHDITKIIFKKEETKNELC